MEEEKKEGYIAGILGLVVTGILVIVGIDVGFGNTSGQAILLFTIVFGGLSIGSLKWPETVGAILAQIFRNIGENTSNSYQDQSMSNQSGDIYGSNNVNVNARDSHTSIHIESKGEGESNQKKNNEMILVVSPLYVNSRPDRKKSYFMKGSPGYRNSAFKSDKDYFEFWDNIRYNQHFCIKYLRDALDNYHANCSQIVGEMSDDDYLKAETFLIQKIEKRYGELLDD